ncbi:MAG: hydrogenase subunit MbhD domain-containing protein [Sphingomonadales bacterium]
MSLALDLVLCALILGVGLATVIGPGVFRAVIFFITYGLLLSIGWARLGAYDVALAEAALSAGLTGVLLLVAHGRLRRMQAEGEPRANFNLSAALAGAALALALGWAWFQLPAPTAPDLAQALPESGVGNPVTAVLLNFRAWDTLLESVVLLAALIGSWMLARDDDWDAPLGLRYHALPRGVLASFGRVLPPIGLIFGVYLVWAGAESTGGAFQGGTVLAAVALVAMMAGVLRPPRVVQANWRFALVLGPGVFLLSGLAGAAMFGGFLTLPPALAKWAILMIEAALTVSIAVTLALVVIGPPEERGQGA